MRRSLIAVAVGVALLACGVAAAVWAVPYLTTARSLYLFEQESPTEVVDGSIRQGAGLLGLDVVTLDDGRVLEVHRQGEPRAGWPRPAFLVGEHGARYADEAPAEGAWWPFALRAGAGGLGGLLAVGLGLILLVRGGRWLGFVIFGQRDPESRPASWVPGSGGHGSGGGQVPPYVPYRSEWDPDRRIR